MTDDKRKTKKFIQYYGKEYVKKNKRRKRKRSPKQMSSEKWFEPCPLCEKPTKPYYGKTTKDGYMILIYRCHTCPKQWRTKKVNIFDKDLSFPL